MKDSVVFILFLISVVVFIIGMIVNNSWLVYPGMGCSVVFLRILGDSGEKENGK